MVEKEDIMQELMACTTLNGENIIDIITSMSDNEINDYVWCWKERISEEIQTRIATGIVTPIRALPWCFRGIGWDSLNNDIPF